MLTTAARVLNLFSALVIVVTGIYIEITFAHFFSTAWKLVIAAAVTGYIVIHARRAMWRKCEE